MKSLMWHLNVRNYALPSEYNCRSLQHCIAPICEVNTNVDEKGRLKVFKKSDPRAGNHWDRACIVRHNHDGKNKILKRYKRNRFYVMILIL